MTPAPYTIYEAEVAIYYADASGTGAGELAFASECTLEALTLESKFTTRRIEAHGSPFAELYHEDESHRVVMRDFFRVRAMGSVFRPQRNQSYILVARFLDRQSGAWTKQTYFAGKFPGRTVEFSPTAAMAIELEARYLIEVDGLENPPGLNVSLPGSVRYVDAYGSLTIYTYDFDTGTLATPDVSLLAGRASITETGGVLRFTIGGTPVMAVSADGLRCKLLTVIGGTAPLQTAAVPRLEFWGPFARQATLTAAGELCVPQAREVDAQEDDVTDFEWEADGSWVASFSANALAALQVIETDVIP